MFISRDEDGRTRTKIIVQRRFYLDPGTEVLPGDEHNHDYQSLPNQSAFSVLDNTPFGNNQSALPGAFTSGRQERKSPKNFFFFFFFFVLEILSRQLFQLRQDRVAHFGCGDDVGRPI